MKTLNSRKRAIKILNRICQGLPDKTYQVAHRLSKVMYQDAEGVVYPSKPEDMETRPVDRYVQEHKRNNKRLCLHIWDRFGWPGVQYLFEMTKREQELLAREVVESSNASVTHLQPQEAQEINEQGDSLGLEKVEI